jgi:pimeloyl-ACP methyl ester carboxylesterase
MAHRVTVEGLSALVEQPTSAAGAPLLFVHGYFGRAVAFERMMADLAGRGHYCCAPDLPGHGDSSSGKPLGSLSVRDYADHVGRVAASIGKPVIIGHSMGGLIGQMLAAQGLARALVLLAPAPPRGIPVLTLRVALAQLRYMPAILASRIVRPGRSDLNSLVLNRVPDAEREVVLDMLVPDSGRAGREMSLLGIPVDRNAVTVPVLVISGDRDRFIPLSRSRRVARRYRAELRVAPGRGHMLIIEPGFEELCEWVASWLRDRIDERQKISA